MGMLESPEGGVFLENDPCSTLTSEVECLNSKLCKTTAQVHCVMGSLADHGLDLKPK